MYHHIRFVLIKSGNLRNASCHLLTTVFYVFMSVACILTRFAQISQLSAVIPNIYATFYTIYALLLCIGGFLPPNRVLSLAL